MPDRKDRKKSLGETKVYNRKVVRQILKRMHNTNKISNWWKRLQGYPIG